MGQIRFTSIKYVPSSTLFAKFRDLLHIKTLWNEKLLGMINTKAWPHKTNPLSNHIQSANNKIQHVRSEIIIPMSHDQTRHTYKSIRDISLDLYEPAHDKPSKRPVRQSKTRISQGICPSQSESSLGAQVISLDLSCCGSYILLII